MSYMGTICPQGPEDCKSVGDLTSSGNPPTAEDGISNMPTILEEAQEAIFGARNVNYGHPRDNFTHTAKLWSAHKGVEFSAQDVAEFMVLVKLSRLQNGYHRDSVVDIAGYAGTIERLQEPVDPVIIHTPERWNSLHGAPKDRVVEDKDGDRYVYNDERGQWYWTGRDRYLDEQDLTVLSMFAPFTIKASE